MPPYWFLWRRGRNSVRSQRRSQPLGMVERRRSRVPRGQFNRRSRQRIQFLELCLRVLTHCACPYRPFGVGHDDLDVHLYRDIRPFESAARGRVDSHVRPKGSSVKHVGHEVLHARSVVLAWYVRGFNLEFLVLSQLRSDHYRDLAPPMLRWARGLLASCLRYVPLDVLGLALCRFLPRLFFLDRSQLLQQLLL